MSIRRVCLAFGAIAALAATSEGCSMRFESLGVRTQPSSQRETSRQTAFGGTGCVDQRLPGMYTLVTGTGRFDPTTGVFRASAGPHGKSMYFVDRFGLPTPTPVPTPTPISTPTPIATATPTPGRTPLPVPQPPTPTPVVQYHWNGIYDVVGGPGRIQRGCFSLFVSQPAPGAPFRGDGVGYPSFARSQQYTVQPIGFGHIARLTIEHLDARGGTGSFTIDEGWRGAIHLGPRTN